MPLSRTCDKWVVAMRFPHANFPRNAALDEAYILLPVPPNANEQGPVNLRIFVEAADSSAALSGACLAPGEPVISADMHPNALNSSRDRMHLRARSVGMGA